MTPPTEKTIITNDDGASTASTLSRSRARTAGKPQPGHRHGSRALPPPRPVSSCLHGYVSLRTGTRAQALVLPGILGVSLWVRRVILSPSQTRGSYLRPTIRSFIGISALSVILMCSGQTSVQHLVMLHRPQPKSSWAI